VIEFDRRGEGRLGANGEATVDLRIEFASPLETDDQFRLKELVTAWYGVGFEGGYEGTMLHELQEVEVTEPALRIRLRVGGDCSSALRVLGRCLTFIDEEGWMKVVSARSDERPYS
jgi:hypothetical protein